MLSTCEELKAGEKCTEEWEEASQKIRGPAEQVQLMFLHAPQSKLLHKMRFGDATFPEVQTKYLGQMHITYELAINLLPCVIGEKYN